MNPARDPIGQQEVCYFGKVTASVSHELKNVLAILNEHAGLLQDFASLATQGQPLDVERIRRLAATMQMQISRGDIIVKRMNRFAHSADREYANVNLNELVTLVVELFGRNATTRGVTVDVQAIAVAVNIKTHVFVLEAMLGSLLDLLTVTISGIDKLSIELHASATGAQIRMPGLAEHASEVEGVLESNEIRTLLAALHANAGFRREGGELFITLPDSIDA